MASGAYPLTFIVKFKMRNSLLFMLSVGFHRYVLENFSGNTLEGVNEKEVKEFDHPSEVSNNLDCLLW